MQGHDLLNTLPCSRAQVVLKVVKGKEKESEFYLLEILGRKRKSQVLERNDQFPVDGSSLSTYFSDAQ